MRRMLCSDWLPERQDGAILPARDCPFRGRKENFAKVQSSAKAGARKFSFAKYFP